MKTVKRSDLIDLASQMVARYQPNAENEYDCPICTYVDEDKSYGKIGLFRFNRCKLCFNRINKGDKSESETIWWTNYGCVNMKTFEYNDLRLLYWEQVLEYLNSLTIEDVFLGQLRYKCNQIDQLLM
jgi:hypothetical protein